MPSFFSRPDFQFFIFLFVSGACHLYRLIFSYWWVWIMPLMLIAMSLSAVRFVPIIWPSLLGMTVCIGVALILSLMYCVARPSVRLKTDAYYKDYTSIIFASSAALSFFLICFCGVYQLKQAEFPLCVVGRGWKELIASVFCLWPFFSPALCFDPLWVAWVVGSPFFAFTLLFLFDRVPIEALVLGVLRILLKQYPLCLFGYAIWTITISCCFQLLDWFELEYLFGLDWHSVTLYILLPIVVLWWKIMYIKTVYENANRILLQ